MIDQILELWGPTLQDESDMIFTQKPNAITLWFIAESKWSIVISLCFIASVFQTFGYAIKRSIIIVERKFLIELS